MSRTGFPQGAQEIGESRILAPSLVYFWAKFGWENGRADGGPGPGRGRRRHFRHSLTFPKPGIEVIEVIGRVGRRMGGDPAAKWPICEGISRQCSAESWNPFLRIKVGVRCAHTGSILLLYVRTCSFALVARAQSKVKLATAGSNSEWSFNYSADTTLQAIRGYRKR